ncbi:hypothetical protein GCM10022252_76290 [Streptosporangium oxazolinicum]|uniref:Homeodomain phBC6A51-type domain-containing protein n=1 Tax=Streptosporangium oxazolinicum TaxID=909287 RepID=A0ABP8BL28_9ACTN
MSDEEPKVGRPIKLTPELQEDLFLALKGGHSIASAAELVGIAESTVHHWRNLGLADNAPDLYADFAAGVIRARAKARDILVAAAFADAVGGVEIKRTIRPDGSEEVQTTPPNGRVALELLSRMHPVDWVQRKAIEVSNPKGESFQVSHNVDLSGLAERVVEAARAAEAELEAEHAAGGDSL